jgi:hypothetical protein
MSHYREDCDPCLSTGFEKGIEIIIRNNTDHPIDLSTSAPVRVAVVCATNMTEDGRLTAPLPAFPPWIFVDLPHDPNQWPDRPTYDTPGTSLAPGAQATNPSSYGYGGEGVDPGTATCEAALVATSDGSWKPETLSVVARIPNIPTYSFQVVVPAPTTTSPQTTTTASASTSASA